MSLLPGARLGPYEISGPIGAGGMGEVYRARDTRLGREVAIKVLPHELSGDPDRLARFEREARGSSSLNHRNIVTIHDFTSRDDETYLVMELVRGESLRDLLTRGALPLKKLLSIAAGIAEGLSAAHAASLVHRDLKPENIMVTGDGTPKILDFGLVKSSAVTDATNTPTDAQMTRAGVVMGTASYMSPEQARGEAVDFRTDHFSFGLVLYEMATGKHPFRRATPVDTLASILSDDPPRLPEALPEPFVWIVERCLAKNPAERYGSTSDLAHDLQRVSGAPAILGAREEKRSGPAPGRTWPLIAMTAMAMAIVLAILMMRRPRAAAPMELALAVPGVERVIFSEIAPPVVMSPDGTFVVVLGIGSDGIDRLWLHDFRSRTTRPIADSEHAYGATWSPDSRSIAYCASGKLKTISVDGGPPHVICDALPPGMPAWSGDTILFVLPSGIFRVNTGGGTPRAVVRGDPVHPADVPMWPQFLPDGKHFLYLVALRKNEEIEHELMAGSLDGGPPKRVAAIDSRAVFASGRLLFIRDGTLLAQPFDPRGLRFTGEPRTLLDGVYYFRSTGLAAFSVSDNGLLTWTAARPRSHEVWFDRGGMEAGSIGSGVFAGGRLSPDGGRYAASLVDPKQGTSDIWIYDLARRNAQRLTFHLTEESSPVWSPDGRTIDYRCDVLGPPDIFRWNLGEDHGTLLYRGPAIEQPEDVSPDGKSLLFVAYNRTVGSRILVLPLDPPGKPRVFSATPFNEISPRFSPDGHWVAYQSDVSGRPEIYLRPFQGAALSARVSTDGGTHPRWRHDGKELFFLGSAGRLMSAAVRSGASAAAPRMLFRAPGAVDFEPAADGSRFLVQIEEHASDPPVHLLIDWPARLR